MRVLWLPGRSPLGQCPRNAVSDRGEGGLGQAGGAQVCIAPGAARSVVPDAWGIPRRIGSVARGPHRIAADWRTGARLGRSCAGGAAAGHHSDRGLLACVLDDSPLWTRDVPTRSLGLRAAIGPLARSSAGSAPHNAVRFYPILTDHHPGRTAALLRRLVGAADWRTSGASADHRAGARCRDGGWVHSGAFAKAQGNPRGRVCADCESAGHRRVDEATDRRFGAPAPFLLLASSTRCCSVLTWVPKRCYVP